MFRPFRLIALGALALAIYSGFYAAPGGAPGPSDFDPAGVARHEAATWRAARARDEMSAFTSAVRLQRELHRYSWFRSAQTGWALSRVAVMFSHMTTRFERALPGLEEMAMVEQQWRAATFNPREIARTRLSWMVAARDSSERADRELAVTDMALEYSQRYQLPAGRALASVTLRADAFRMILAPGAEPDWALVTQLLERSYADLKASLVASRQSV